MILEYYKLKGSLEQKATNLMEQQKELKDIQQEYAAYDLYMRCMHSNGIAYDIIKKQLPVINEEVAKVLAKSGDCKALESLNVGDRIIYNGSMIEEMKIDGETYYLLLENYVLCSFV